MRLPWIKTPAMVGLDIRSDNLCLVQLQKQHQQWVFKHLEHRPLSPNCVVDGRINDWDEVIAVLAPLVQALQLNGAPAAISLPHGSVRLQQLSLPAGLDEQGIEAEIKLALQHDFPGVVDMLAMDYFVLPSSNMTSIVFAVTRQEDVAEYVAGVNAAGLNLKIMDVDHYALLRLVTNKQLIDIKKVTVFVHRNTRGYQFLVIKDHEIIVQHSWTDDQKLSSLLAKIKEDILKLTIDEWLWSGEVDDVFFTVLMNISNQKIKHIHLMPELHHNSAKNFIPEIAFACGMAMREVPKW